MIERLYGLSLLACLATSCAGGPQATASSSTTPARPVEFWVADINGLTPEHVAGTAFVFGDHIDVAVTDARVIDDTPHERLRRIRAQLVVGDTADRWSIARQSAPVDISVLRRLPTTPGDTIRFVIPNTGNVALGDVRLSFQLEASIAPPGMAPGIGTHPIHGPLGGLAAR